MWHIARITSIILLAMIIAAQKSPPKNRKQPNKDDNKGGKNKITPTTATTLAPSTAWISTPNKNSKQPVINTTALSVDQCCSDECCVSLTYSRSVAKKEGIIPELKSDAYFCENMDISTIGNCHIDFIVFPLSSHCNLQETIYNMRWVTQSQDATGYQRAALENDVLKLNNAETLYLNSTDTNNPIVGFHAVKFPVIPNQQISFCTLIGFGDIVDKMNGEGVRIGYVGAGRRFACSNETVRDICSVAMNSDVVIVNSNQKNNAKHIHFLLDNEKFSSVKHNEHKYTSRELIEYCIILFVCIFVIIVCAVYVCYRWKRVDTTIEKKNKEHGSMQI